MQYILQTFFLCAFLFLSQSAFCGENCSQLGGTCKNACGQGEQPESGAFEDCGEAQECCAVHDASKDQVRCCITSFETRHFGALNCGLPQNNRCSQGSGSSVACENLNFCKNRQ
jgi:hypothetical protein